MMNTIYDLETPINNIKSLCTLWKSTGDYSDESATNLVAKVINEADYVSQSIIDVRHLASEFAKCIGSEGRLEEYVTKIIKAFIVFIPLDYTFDGRTMGYNERTCFTHLWFYFFYHVIQQWNTDNTFPAEKFIKFLEGWPFGLSLDVEYLLILEVWFHKELEHYSPSLSRRLSQITEAISTPIFDSYRELIPHDVDHPIPSIFQIISYSPSDRRTLPDYKCLAVSLLENENKGVDIQNQNKGVDVEKEVSWPDPPAIILSTALGRLFDISLSKRDSLRKAELSAELSDSGLKALIYSAFLGRDAFFQTINHQKIDSTNFVTVSAALLSHVPQIREWGDRTRRQVQIKLNDLPHDIYDRCFKYALNKPDENTFFK